MRTIRFHRARCRAYRLFHPRRYREGQLVEQRHQFLDIDPDLRDRHAPAPHISRA